MNIATILISSLAFIVSVISCIYNWQLNRKNLKISFLKFNDKDIDIYTFIKDENKYVLLIKIKIINKSKNPIKISSIHLQFEDKDIKALHVPIPTLGDGYNIFDTFVKYDEGTFALPYEFNSFDILESQIAFVYFPNDNPVVFDENINGTIIFNTSRGINKKEIVFTFQKD